MGKPHYYQKVINSQPPLIFVSASATERTRDFCGLFPLHIAKYAVNRCIYSTNLSIPFCAAPL